MRRRQSHTSWALKVIAPWFLGASVLVSFTASAEQDFGAGWNAAPISKATFGRAGLDDGLPGPRLELAHLDTGALFALEAEAPDEREPHLQLKPNAQIFPEVDRTHKGDPFVSMRPTLEGRLPGHFEPYRMASLDFAFAPESAGPIGHQPEALAPTAAAASPSADAQTAPPDEAQTTQKGSVAALPPRAASAATPSDPAKERAAHGATPSVPRAVTLSSSTPAQPDAAPIEAAPFLGATLALPGASRENPDRPDYASMIAPNLIDSEKRCLAEAVYFEARSEPEAGQAAVAQVILNRVSSGLYPSTICGVVYQNRSHFRRCQFSFACAGRSLRITERASWSSALRTADSVLAGNTYLSEIGSSTHYHANYVRPRWARRLKRMDVIGHHVFYRLRHGQS